MLIVNYLGDLYSLPEKYFDPALRYWYLNHDKGSDQRRLGLFVIDVLFWLCISIVMSGPAYAQSVHYQNNAEKSPAILIVLDASASMNAADVEPSRFLRAKNELLLMTEKLKANQRVGLVLYTVKPHLLFPPTADKFSQQHYINLLEPDMLPFAGSDISEAIKFGFRFLSDRQEHKNSQIILITDGDSDKTDEIIKELENINQEFSLSVLGVGELSPAPVPALDGESQWLIENNAPVYSSRNDKLLKQIADLFDGAYRSISGPEIKINSLISHSDVKIELDGARSNTQWVQLYHPFLLLAALLFFAKIIIQRE